MIRPDIIIDPVAVKLLELSMSMADSASKGLTLVAFLQEIENSRISLEGDVANGTRVMVER